MASDTSDFGAVGVDCVWAPEMNECEAEIAAIFLANKILWEVSWFKNPDAFAC